MSDIPIVKPVNVKEYDFKQSKYEVAPKLPFTNNNRSEWFRKRNITTIYDIGYL